MPDFQGRQHIVLLVEDEIAHAELIRRAFDLRGSRVSLIVARSLREARTAAAESTPDVAVVDLLLPDGKGIEYLSEQGEERPYPIIIMTSHGDEQIAVEAIRAGAFDYIVKSETSLLEMPHIVERALREWSHIREKRQAEQSLRASEERFRQVISSISDHIYMAEIAPDGRFQYHYLSPNCQDLTGYTAEHFLEDAQQWLALIHSEDQNLVATHWERLGHGQHSEIEYRICPAQGNLTWVRDNGRVKQTNNTLTVYGVISNITERKQIEAELQQYRDRLEYLVVQRTAQLEQASKEAQAANRAKSDFLSNMSHELRTPLNGILGYAQILKRDTNLTPRQKEALDIIHESGHHLLTLINDILDLSKIEASHMELDPSDIYLPKFLSDIANIIQMRAQQKQIDFHFEPEPELPVGIVADEKRLRQVLINLLDNAIKFTDQGQVTFRVVVRFSVLSPTPGVTLRFVISDTGIGISQEQLSRIFDPFEQAGDRRHRAEGTGLGLAISHRLVNLMGSSLHVKSQPDQGSTFWFDLSVPVTKLNFATERAQALAANAHHYLGPTRRALVIDDKKHNLLVLSDMLESMGVNAVLATSGEEGLEKAQAMQPDIIFVDLVMPGMSGYETVQAMRQIPVLQQVPIIAVSASTFDQDRINSLSAGCNAFLPKPLEEGKLRRLLTEQLQLAWQPNETVDPPGVATGKEEETAVSPPFTLPPAADMETLLDMARRGDMRGIRTHANQLSQRSDAYKPFAATLQKLAQAYEERKLLQLIQSLMPRPE